MIRNVYVLLSLILATILVLCIQAQRELRPVLIGDFEAFPCSEFQYLADTFMAELAKDAGSFGYVVNSGAFDHLSALIWREELIKAQMEIRNFDSSRVFFDRGESNGPIRTRFWKIPSADARPRIESVNNSLYLSKRKRPFILIEQTFFNDSECPDVNYPGLFAKFLEANPRARGNIVVYAQTLAQIRRREKATLNALVSVHGISRTRLRTYRLLVKNDPEHPKGIEYWYLP